ncbi:MAG: AAA family ATPase [Oscillospiraceae bacterium]|nr:AAA family ATPase [Oscillospiraceae bacterium]
MIIRHMQGTFGTLDGEQLRLDTGLNIIYAPNESGKSTWCAFLRAMLYGIDTSQRTRAGFVPDKQKYAPWSGKPMAGELELEQGGKCITIRRWTEAPNAPLRGFSAVYTGTDIPVPGLTAADAGEQLTGVSAEVFARTAFIGQGGLVVTGTPELERRISAIVTSGEEASSYTEADAQLRAWLRRRRSGQHGALPELEGRITTVEEQLHRLERNAQEQAACAAEIAQTDAELQTVTEQMNAARQRQRRAALSSMGEEKSNLRTLEQTLEQARRDAAARRTALEQTHFGVQTPDEAGETAERDAQRAESLAGTAEHGGKPYFWIAALVLSALCAALGYLVAQPLYYAAIALAVLAVVLLVVARSGKKRAQQASAALGKLLRSYGAQDADGIYYQAEVHRAAYRACAAAMQAEQKAAAALEDAREHQCETHERLLQSLDFESGTGEAAALYQRKCALESVRTRLRTQQAQLTGAALAIGDPMALKSEHAQLLEQRDALERQYAAIALAIEALGRADSELQSRFSPQLAQKAADYMDYLTDGRYDELVLARDLSAKARSADDPTPRDTAYLSAGTADLLYLSVRLALCELTCPADDPCPLVLDDTLVNFDDARAKRAMALFHEIAQHRQVILFTCHERDCPAQG